MSLRKHYLEAHERRARSHQDALVHEDYTPPVHWGVYPDGVRVYRGGELLVTLTPDMLRDGMLEECARVACRTGLT